MCAYLQQADPLYMGVPNGGVCSLLWLLLFQCDAVGATDAAPLLGCSDSSNGSQVYLQQSEFIDVSKSILN